MLFSIYKPLLLTYATCLRSYANKHNSGYGIYAERVVFQLQSYKSSLQGLAEWIDIFDRKSTHTIQICSNFTPSSN